MPQQLSGWWIKGVGKGLRHCLDAALVHDRQAFAWAAEAPVLGLC